MRSLTALLVLLLALPGLVLPAGFALHLCRCASAAASADPAAVRSCCAAHAASVHAAKRATCCQHGGCRTPDDGVARIVPTCRCVWIKLAEHPSKPALPQPAPSQPTTALPPAGVAAIPVPRDVGQRQRPLEVARPPPPLHHRNLPLLL